MNALHYLARAIRVAYIGKTPETSWNDMTPASRVPWLRAAKEAINSLPTLSEDAAEADAGQCVDVCPEKHMEDRCEIGASPVNGISLRDWFAGKYIAGIVANPEHADGPGNTAEWAYKFADALLAERAKGGVK